MAAANKMIWQALQKRCTRLRRSRNGIFFVSVDLLIHSEQYANTSMAILIRRVTCKSSFFFSFWGQKKVLSCKIYLRGRRPCLFHAGSERLSYSELRPSQQPFYRIFR